MATVDSEWEVIAEPSESQSQSGDGEWEVIAAPKEQSFSVPVDEGALRRDSGVFQPSQFGGGASAFDPGSDGDLEAALKLPFDAVGAGVGALTEKVIEPAAHQFNKYNPTSIAMRAITGIPQPKEGESIIPESWTPLANEKGVIPALTRIARGITTEGGVATLPFAFSKPIQALYAGGAVSAVPQQIQNVVEAPTGVETRDAATELGANLVLAGLMGKGLMRGDAPTPKFKTMPREFKPAIEGVKNALDTKAEQTVSGLRPRNEIIEVPAEVSRGEADAGGSKRTQSQAEVAAELGIKPVAAGEGLWQFNVTDAAGKEIPFAVKADASKADIAARAKLVLDEMGGQKQAPTATVPSQEQLGKFKESSGKVSWTPDYFKSAGDNVFSPDWWVSAFDKIADAKYDGTGTSYQIGKFIRELGEEKGNLVIDALEQAREKMAAEIDLVRKDPKNATPEQMAKAMKYGTGAIQLPREAWEAALDSGSAKGELAGTPLTRKVANEKAQAPQGQEVLEPATAQPFFDRQSEAQGLGRPSLPPSSTPASTPSPAAPAVPPTRPPGTPPTPAPGPAPAGGPVTLTDIYKIFEPAPKTGTSLKQKAVNAVEAFRTGFSSKFRPINKLAEDIAKAYGGARKDIAGIFEQLKGSSGKGEADIYRFDQDVSKLVGGEGKDFNAYMFLRRGLDRLTQDVADVAAGLPERRKVSSYTIPDLQAKLSQLESNLGPDRVAKFQAAADKYQKHMDQALQLQVDSGRMSPAVYQAIKDGNQFYAPFKVMKYIEESMRPEGSGKKIDTLADFTKAMEGIESPDFKLGDMLGAARQNILLSRILAEKNRAMQHVSDLAAIDTNGTFITKLRSGHDAPKGMEAVNVMEGGKPVRYAVNPDAAQAIQLFGENGGGIISKALSAFSVPFRAGATALNLPFQVSNLLADVPRQALVSKYGIKGVTDLVRYPLDFVESLLSSMLGDMTGYKNKLYQDFLDSSVAGATIQEHLTPKALRTETPTLAGKIGRNVLYAIPDFAKAIEQTSKILGVKRAMRFEGVQSGAQLAKQIPEAVTEIRRFSGSPDFGRLGKWTEQARLNLIYMFLNARIQGAVADVGRLTGRDGAGTAAKTWAKILPAVGLPTAYLYMLNNSTENAEDYAKRPTQEKQNYWLIPKDTYITGQNGEKIRDYWRVPKRESSKWIANMVESALEFSEKRTPETFGKWAQGMMEDISPVNIQGKTAQERMESIAASLNPLIKGPMELASGRDFYRHRDIVPDHQKKASPELQYTDRTADVFKQAALAMPDVAPEFMRSPLMLENMTKNLTAGLFTQFMPSKPVEGRTELENQPLLRRFQALPYTDSSEFDDRMKKYERESADDQLTRFRNANKLIEDNKSEQLPAIAKKMIAQYGPDKQLLERVVDIWVAEKRGVTTQERRVLALPVQQRAQYIIDELSNTSPELKQQALRNFALKRILTEAVAAEMAKQKAQ